MITTATRLARNAAHDPSARTATNTLYVAQGGNTKTGAFEAVVE